MTPTGPLDVLQIIESLGYVQLDTLQIVSRAHHHIIWSRNQNYREPMLNDLLQHDRALFEHYGHDACVLPMAFYPMWQRQFKRMEKRVRKRGGGRPRKSARDAIVEKIRSEGPLSSKSFDSKKPKTREVWSRPAHKVTLDYLWYAGELSTAYRQNFHKYYDLTDRVIPRAARRSQPSDGEQIHWLCTQALQRLGFATTGEIQRFWEACDLDEVKKWIKQNKKLLIDVEVESADGSWQPALALASIEQRLKNLKPPTSRLRILNPFDPVIRDRARLSRLFNFDYRIEIYVPAAKRRWGYYVYPILEGDRLVGRIEVRADRKTQTLNVLNFWREPKVHWGERRHDRLHSELSRLARFAGTHYESNSDMIFDS